MKSSAALLTVLGGLGMIAGTVLVALGHPVPEYITTATIVSLSALAGVSIPTPAARDTTPAVTPVPVPPPPPPSDWVAVPTQALHVVPGSTPDGA